MAKYNALIYHVPDNHRYAIVIDIQLGVPVPIDSFPKNKKFLLNAKALIDTGATGSCISRKFAESIKLTTFKK